MQVVRVFTGSDGRSYFEDAELALPNPGKYSMASEPFDIQQATFREMPVDGFLGLHHPPARQLVVVLDGQVEFRSGTGEARVLGAGDILLGEDLEGEGHSSRELAGPRRTLFLPIADEVDVIRTGARDRL